MLPGISAGFIATVPVINGRKYVHQVVVCVANHLDVVTVLHVRATALKTNQLKGHLLKYDWNLLRGFKISKIW